MPDYRLAAAEQILAEIARCPKCPSCSDMAFNYFLLKNIEWDTDEEKKDPDSSLSQDP